MSFLETFWEIAKEVKSVVAASNPYTIESGTNPTQTDSLNICDDCLAAEDFVGLCELHQYETGTGKAELITFS